MVKRGILQVLGAFASVLCLTSPVLSDSGCDSALCDDVQVFFKMYCQGNVEGQLRLGLSKDFDLEFRAHFDEEPSFSKPDFFLADGIGLVGQRVNEIKVGRSKCEPAEEGGYDCAVQFTAEKAEAISAKFDTEQSVINVILRNGSKDVCLGKFTNNAQRIIQNGQLERVYCSFDPESDSSLWGEGYFDPRGYGAEGESHFHFRFEGFPESGKYKGCVKRGNTFKEVFEFTAWPEGSSDEDIYGKLSEAEASKLASDGAAYSYSLQGDLRKEAEAAGLEFPTAGFGTSGRSLSSINHTVSSNASNSTRSSSNSSSRSSSQANADARSKKKKQKKKRKRGASAIRLLAATSAQAKKSKKGEDIFSWLSFDPLTETEIFIAENCNKRTEEKSFGTVSCGTNDADDRGCAPLVHSPPAGTAKNDSYLGRVCVEPRKYHTVLMIRAEGIPAGSYTVCVNGSSTQHSITVDSNQFGVLHLTDSATVASQDQSMEFTPLSLTDTDVVTISNRPDCTDKTLTGGFGEDD